MGIWKRIAIGGGIVATALWANNSALLVKAPKEAQIRLLAHRGVHQTYAGDARDNDTCRAAKSAPITHRYIENTLPSITQAFALGADVVELDVHLTPDGTFAVFHDWTLDCQTDGTGVTEDTPFETLKTLDLGYGITDDGGATHPLRGQGVGLMPSLKEVLGAQPGPLLVNFKSRRTDEGEVLAERLIEWGQTDQVWAVYGGAPPTRAALSALPDMRGYDKSSLMDCLKRYALWGWSGHVPTACRNTLIAIPQDYAPFLWGWPHRLTKRLKAHGTDVILLGPYDGSGFSSGIDSAKALAQVPAGFDGYIWTNRIEVIGPLVKR
ncbi:glycerophosphodiester phosphodiesterase family protein [Pseudoprimorskyibacter insulae]|uniref:Glycerophosphodiester phosphodiesterase n=1 Tax=Pseudoprimorskyibacter insulae TaxID=1695997 RepID=A0A2R8ANU1_9RHOB|nr:glycerophosphodiester phosphodiesterase family protein [Pseudoprimorskyibacter insulae]SPF77736.1 Glycerophosphodiester phosphodiesterase [Pseudoprimorskyibacter insulae]